MDRTSFWLSRDLAYVILFGGGPDHKKVSRLSAKKMPFTRFVEVGRVVLINYGPDAGKIATVVDVVDGKRILIDGPQNVTGVHRQVITTQRVTLTPVVATGLRHNASQKSLTKAWTEQNIKEKWEATAWAKKLAVKKARATAGDFDRFKVMIAKKQKAKIVAEKLGAR
eukprot:gene6595-7288_t